MSIIDQPAQRTAQGSPVTDRRAWLGLVVLTLPVFLVSMDSSALNLAIPTITAGLDPSAAQLLWIIDIYGFLLAGLLITMGNIGDRIGRRRILLIGATVFGLASVVGAFAPNAEVLIAARAVMGIGGATLMPASLSLITNMFRDPRARAKAIGIWSASFAAAAALGPVIGGVLLHHFWWGSIFLINVPVLVLLLVVAPVLLPEYRSPSTSRFDIVGVVLSLSGILPLVYAIKHTASEGLDTQGVVVALIGVVALASFVVFEAHTDSPLLDLKLFSHSGFTAAILAALGGTVTFAGVTYLSAIYLQSVRGLDVLTAALIGIPMAATVAFGSMVSPRLTSLLGVRWGFFSALTLTAVGVSGLITLTTDSPLWVFMLSTAVAGVGIGVFFTLVSDVAVSEVEPERSGAAAGLSETSFELGHALGLAVLGSIATLVFRDRAGNLPFADTLGETLQHAQQMGGSRGDELAEAARMAFVDSMHVVAVISSVGIFALAVLVSFLLRPKDRRPKTDQPQATVD
ncbi:MFS transporter [Gordonia jinhuaensis]|uniref:Transmembrane-transport protein n=1 Tax=Gordonia jinhuaensis TaxID=1517702 RepID=A0A916X1U5_9ACTN|nr:MFS transporter [Gordonia jinhuaensis]GGB47342.1 putative transmembrane-transport protein [Gordonia jinhuaensis]